MTAVKKRQLQLVRPDDAATAQVMAATPPQPSMPALNRASVFIAGIRGQLRDAESEVGIVDAQIVAERERFDAVIAAETEKHEKIAGVLEWNRNDLLEIADRCKAALEHGK